MAGLEPAASWSQIKHSTKLSYTELWSELQGSNLRPPACKADALPTELSSDGRLTLPKGHIWVFSYSHDGPVICLFNHPGLIRNY